MELDPSQAFRHQVRMRGNPAAPPAATVVHGQARFTVLTARLIRMEWAANGQFEDRATFAFPTRSDSAVPPFTVQTTDQDLIIATDKLTLWYRPQPDRPFAAANLAIALHLNDREVVWHPGAIDAGNLGGTARTLDMAPGVVDLGDGIISRSGWAIFDDSAHVCFSPVDGWVEPRPDADRQDWYFFGYGHDYRAAIEEYTRLFGSFPAPDDARLIPRFALGAWWSRYWAYSDQELRDLVAEFAAQELPLDVLVIDVDWHTPDTWTGYTWNRELFPDPPALLSWLHEQRLHVTLNLHPAEGVQSLEAHYPEFAHALGLDHRSGQAIPFRPSDRHFMHHYFEILHHPLEDEGVDFWWLDWQQGRESEMVGLDPLPWLNHLHFLDAARADRRPMLLSRYGGLGNHRYYVGFSGDTYATWEALQFQPEFTATAANVGYGWWSHDIGGHIGAIEPELFVRWVQFGALSPILRLHGTKHAEAERRPWAFPAPVLEVMRQAYRLRYQLIPYLYTAAWRASQTGLALCLPLYYRFPDDEAAYAARDEYLLGEDLLAAPIVTPADPATDLASRNVWLPPGAWYDWQTHAALTGPGWITISGDLARIPLFARAGAAIPLAPPVTRSAAIPADHLILRIFPPSPGTTSISQVYDDDGATLAYTRGEYEVTAITVVEREGAVTMYIAPVTGHSPSLPAARSLTLEYIAADRPTNVHIDGRPWSAWDHDTTTRITTIQIPVRAKDAGIVIAIG